MKRAIVTGGSGFLGSWLIQELLQNNIKVVTIVRRKEKLLSQIASHPDCTIIEADLKKVNKQQLDLGVTYDVFYHLAWEGVTSNHKNDIRGQMKNIELSVHAMELAEAIACKKFIAAGTVAEYVFCHDIIDLSKQQTPNDFYGAAKVSAYYFLKVMANKKNIPFIWAILPSTFGEGREDSNIITYTIKTLLEKKKPLYGNLNQMWDFLYVSEVVRALRFLGERGIGGKTYGIGSGVYQPLKKYIIKIRDLINPKLELGIGELPEMSKQTVSSCVNIYDLIQDTGFQPRIDFEKGIRNTIMWYQKIGWKKEKKTMEFTNLLEKDGKIGQKLKFEQNWLQI